MKKKLPWLAALVMVVVIFGTIYTVTQQAQRADANYPQVQIAEDTAAALNQGVKPSALVSGRVDMAASLAPFVIIYDRSGQVVSGSGYLDGRVPQLPSGVLGASKGTDYDAVTWQPQSGVRIASVITVAKSYYVLSGRSLKEVERNENRTLQLSTIGEVVSIILLAVIFRLGGLRPKA